MYYSNATLRYWPLWGLCCPLYPLPTHTPFRRNRVAIAYRYANSLPSSRRYSRPAPYTVRSPTVSYGNQVAH